MEEENPAADPWCHPGDYSNSNEDLFELFWQAGGATGKPRLSCLQSSPSAAAPPPPVPSEHISVDPPPSKGVMAASLYPIVRAQDDLAGDWLKQPMAKEGSEPSTTAVVQSLGKSTTETKGKLPATDGMMSSAKDTNTTCYYGEKKKASGGSSGRKGSCHHPSTHNITEKKRRCKITGRLRTLQQLVPGCEKSNQAATLDQTIQYMKSLQQQLQAMNTSVAAVAQGTVMPPPGMVPMVQFGTILPYRHYHTVPMPRAAEATSWYLPAPGASTAAPDASHATGTMRSAPSPWNSSNISTRKRNGGGDSDMGSRRSWHTRS